MQEVHLSDKLYQRAKQRASQAGFESVDAFVAEIVQTEIGEPIENYDHLFTEKVIAHLDQIRAEIESGTKTYTQGEVDGYLQQKSKTWRESRAS